MKKWMRWEGNNGHVVNSLTRVAVALHCTGLDLVKRAYMYTLCNSLPDSSLYSLTHYYYYCCHSTTSYFSSALTCSLLIYYSLTHSLFRHCCVCACCVVVRGAWSDVLSPVESLPWPPTHSLTHSLTPLTPLTPLTHSLTDAPSHHHTLPPPHHTSTTTRYPRSGHSTHHLLRQSHTEWSEWRSSVSGKIWPTFRYCF